MSSSLLRRAGAATGAALGGLAAYDLVQRKHAILRNFPLVGHLRFVLESFGPELRQYVVTSNDEERPFSRDQRRWVYASAKRQINTFGFGTDNDLENADGLVVLRHSPFPAAAAAEGEPGGRPDYVPPGRRRRPSRAGARPPPCRPARCSAPPPAAAMPSARGRSSTSAA